MLFIIALGSSIAQVEDGEFKGKPLFQSDEVLHLRIEADFKKVFSNHDDSTYFTAQIQFDDGVGDNKSMDIKVRTRGNYRRKKSTCSFAPLQIKFPKKKTKNTVFEGQRAVKLVTHCRKSGGYEQNTIIEYLIYKSFNLLSDSSLRVRPVIINYVFNGRKKDSVERFAFFIERPKHLAERLSGRLINAKYVHPDSTDYEHMNLVDMFQFMIGNTDYSVYNMHNIKLVSVDPFKPPVVIPYDFDWSGIISASYARPNPLFEIDNVSVRLYRGFQRSKEELDHTIGLFNRHKKAIYNLYESNLYLNKNEKKRVINYMDQFYYIINDQKKLEKNIIQSARIDH